MKKKMARRLHFAFHTNLNDAAIVQLQTTMIIATTSDKWKWNNNKTNDSKCNGVSRNYN